MSVRPFPDQLKHLVQEKGTSIARVYDAATWRGEGLKPSKAQLDKAMTGQRPLRPEVMEMLADALGADPNTFAEYRLAKARSLFDEREVGLEAAIANLQAAPEVSRLLDRPGSEAAAAAESAARRREQRRDTAASDPAGPRRAGRAS